MQQFVAFNVELLELARLPPAIRRAALPASDQVTAQILSVPFTHLSSTACTFARELADGKDLCRVHCSGLNLDGSFATFGI